MVIQRDIIKRLENQNYAEKKKTWDIIGALLGLAILIVGVIFAIVPPESYRANSVDRISFGADYYTEQYNATRVAVDNTAVTANNLREIGQAQAHYFGSLPPRQKHKAVV